MNYPDEIVLEGEDLQFWKNHSEIIADLAGNDTELIMEENYFNIINPASQLVDEDIYPPETSRLYWMMFVDLAQGNKVGTFNSAGLAQLNTRKGYTKKRLMRLLDYLDFSTNKSSIEALKSYMRSHQINSTRETVPRGVGVRKAPSETTYDRIAPRYNYNYNDVYNNVNYKLMKEEEEEENLENNNNVSINNNYVSNGEESLKRLLATLTRKPLPHSKTAKERKRRHRKHTRMTKRMKPKNLRKPKKNKRTAKAKVNTKNVNDYSSINTFANNNNNNMKSTFSFDD